MEIVSFVILHYKDIEVTDRCVRSILQMDDPENRIRILIVDNDIGEKQEKRQQLQSRYGQDSRITVLPIMENGGFSYANNKGYRLVREQEEISYIIVLNNDIEFPQKNFLELLDKSYEQHPCHILGPDIIRQGTGEHQNPMDTRLRTREEAQFTVRMNRLALKFYPVLYPLVSWKLNREEKVRLQQKAENETFYQTVQENIVPFGACLIFTPEFVKQEVVAFTPETQFFYEEYILTGRCRKKGYRIVYDPALQAYHESGAATKAEFAVKKEHAARTARPTAQKHAARNAQSAAQKHAARNAQSAAQKHTARTVRRAVRKRTRFMLERTAAAAEIYLKTLD